MRTKANSDIGDNREIQPELKLFPLTQGCLRYLHISNTAHDLDQLPVGKSVNIRSILRYNRKFLCRLDLPEIKNSFQKLFSQRQPS